MYRTNAMSASVRDCNERRCRRQFIFLRPFSLSLSLSLSVSLSLSLSLSLLTHTHTYTHDLHFPDRRFSVSVDTIVCCLPTISYILIHRYVIFVPCRRRCCHIYMKRDSESALTKGKELDLAAPESNALFLLNYI